MAVLQKIRVKFGLAISIIIALALLSFIIDPGTLQSAMQTMSSKYDVGRINGKNISYTDFLEETDKYSTINEMLTGSTSQTEESQAAIRDAAWQGLIDKYLFVKSAKDAGLTVGEDEMVDLTTGANPSAMITQLFTDETGEFDPQNVVNFVKTIPDDATGRYQTLWDYVQNSVYTQQFYNKYASLFTYGNVLNKTQLRRMGEENNNTADVEYVMIPYGYDMDSTVVVTEKEIRDYYDAHKKFYKQNASRDIEYVVYEVVPSEGDIAATLDEVNGVYEEFSTTENLRSFLTKNSDRPLSSYWYKSGELNTVSTEVNDFVFAPETKTGDVSPVIRDGNTFYVAKVTDIAARADSVYVKHILLTSEDAQAKADSLLNVVKSGETNFATLAVLYSADQSSMADGELGAIGWMTQNYMIQGMESVLDAKVNEPFVLNTIYGTHVVLVTEKTKPVEMRQIALLEKEAVASKETFNEYYAKANKFATIAAGSYDNYRAAVDTMGVYSHPISNVTEATSSYGAIDNAKEITRWVFDAKKNAVSNIITVNNNYFFVVTLKEIHKEGTTPIRELASDIKTAIYLDKLGEKISSETAEQIKGLSTLEEVADKLGYTVSTSNAVAFSSLTSQTLDPKFLGAIASAPLNTVCGPVAGSIGVYVFQVTGRETGSFYTEEDAKNYNTQMNQYYTQMILPVLEEVTNYKDNRARFF